MSRRYYTTVNKYEQHYLAYMDDDDSKIERVIGYFGNNGGRFDILEHCTELFNNLEANKELIKIIHQNNKKLCLITRIIIAFAIILVGVIFYLLQSDLHFH